MRGTVSKDAKDMDAKASFTKPICSAPPGASARAASAMALAMAMRSASLQSLTVASRVVAISPRSTRFSS